MLIPKTTVEEAEKELKEAKKQSYHIARVKFWKWCKKAVRVMAWIIILVLAGWGVFELSERVSPDMHPLVRLFNSLMLETFCIGLGFLFWGIVGDLVDYLLHNKANNRLRAELRTVFPLNMNDCAALKVKTQSDLLFFLYVYQKYKGSEIARKTHNLLIESDYDWIAKLGAAFPGMIQTREEWKSRLDEGPSCWITGKTDRARDYLMLKLGTYQPIDARPHPVNEETFKICYRLARNRGTVDDFRYYFDD